MSYTGLLRTTIAFLVLNTSIVVFAGTTGKISGTVTDAKTGEAVIGASVSVVGTKMGGVTDIEGFYYIINIPPGTVELTASSIGYQSKRQTSVFVKVDQTTTLNFKLTPTNVEMNEVVVQAERKVVEVDRTYTISATTAEDLKMMPQTKVSETVELQAGVVDGHFRGGRKNEVAYLIDGVRVMDAYSNSQGTEVNTAAVQELQVISGNFNAEYGQAMSGVVNIVTKEGTEDKYHGSVSATGGGYFTPHSKEFPKISEAATLNQITDVGATFSGPTKIIPGLGFFFDGRYQDDGGWQFGENRYNSKHFVGAPDTSAWINLPGQGSINRVTVTGNGRNELRPSALLEYETRIPDDAIHPIDGIEYLFRSRV